jgi:hypothetical protein
MFEKKLSLLAGAGVWDCEGLNWFTEEEEGVGSVCVAGGCAILKVVPEDWGGSNESEGLWAL